MPIFGNEKNRNMSLSVQTRILGQQADQNCSYCYLYEPLEVSIQESLIQGEKIYIDLEIYLTSDSNTLISTEVNYAVYDINTGESLSVDLMKMARQYHDANVYKYANMTDVISTVSGWHSIVSKYKYKFLIRSDETTTPIQVFKLPIIGGRNFKDFTPTVDENQKLTETDFYNVDLSGRWAGFPIVTNQLVSPTLVDSRPIVTSTIQSTGCKSDGYVIWKSRLGGWVTWGMDIKTDNNSGSYMGSISQAYFESNSEFNGQPYVPVNYTGIESSYGYSLKALSLSTNELNGVSGIHYSPAIYFMKDSNSMELMRKTGASTPISSLSSGGDFSLSLSNISKSMHKTR